MRKCSLLIVVVAVLMFGSFARAGEIHKVALSGDLKAVAAIIAHDPLLVNSWQDAKERSPLHIAAQTDNVKMARLLIDCGAAVNAAGIKRGKDVYTGIGVAPLHIAAGKGSEKMVRLLIEKGADVNAPNLPIWNRLRGEGAADHEALYELAASTRTHKQTPLHFAAIMGKTEAARLLIDAGAKVDVKDFNLNTPAHFAAYFGNKQTLALLLEKGADVKAATRDGFGVMHFAAANGDLKIAGMLLEKGAAPGLVACKQGQFHCSKITPLHLASIKGDSNMAKKLVNSGANVKLKAARGASARDLAEMFGHAETVKVLSIPPRD